MNKHTRKKAKERKYGTFAPGITIFLVCFFGFLSIPVLSEDIQVEGYEYHLDIPEAWELYDAEDLSRITFTDPTHAVFLQTIVYPGDKFSRSMEIFETIKKQLGAEGDAETFLFNLKDSAISELTFKTGEYTALGCFIFINSKEYDYVVFCFTSEELFETYLAFIYSALDSFSLNSEGLKLPGPISQYIYPFPGPDQKEKEVKFQKTQLSLLIDENDFDVSQMIIEREAIVLSAYDDYRIEAWERFFRMIYRDTYHRLDTLYKILEIELQKQGQNKREMIISLLTWLQDFTYTRTETLADFLSPVAAAFGHEGDCDSRALLYLILLDHMGVDAVLFVSARFSHSAVGINYDIVKKQGASMEFEGKKYIYAELTAKVDLGQIAADVADPAGWITFKLF